MLPRIQANGGRKAYSYSTLKLSSCMLKLFGLISGLGDYLCTFFNGTIFCTQSSQ